MCFVAVQIDEEVAKLLQLKAQLGDEGTKKFLLKTPKVNIQTQVLYKRLGSIPVKSTVCPTIPQHVSFHKTWPTQ